MPIYVSILKYFQNQRFTRVYKFLCHTLWVRGDFRLGDLKPVSASLMILDVLKNANLQGFHMTLRPCFVRTLKIPESLYKLIFHEVPIDSKKSRFHKNLKGN